MGSARPILNRDAVAGALAGRIFAWKRRGQGRERKLTGGGAVSTRERVWLPGHPARNTRAEMRRFKVSFIITENQGGVRGCRNVALGPVGGWRSVGQQFLLKLPLETCCRCHRPTKCCRARRFPAECIFNDTTGRLLGQQRVSFPFPVRAVMGIRNRSAPNAITAAMTEDTCRLRSPHKIRDVLCYQICW